MSSFGPAPRLPRLPRSSVPDEWFACRGRLRSGTVAAVIAPTSAAGHGIGDCRALPGRSADLNPVPDDGSSLLAYPARIYK